jgi:hypothetical protein
MQCRRTPVTMVAQAEAEDRSRRPAQASKQKQERAGLWLWRPAAISSRVQTNTANGRAGMGNGNGNGSDSGLGQRRRYRYKRQWAMAHGTPRTQGPATRDGGRWWCVVVGRVAPGEAGGTLVERAKRKRTPDPPLKYTHKNPKPDPIPINQKPETRAGHIAYRYRLYHRSSIAYRYLIGR